MIDVSVVIPTFRRPRLLAEAIASVLAQRDVATELIVVDDSPEGSAREVVEQQGDRRLTYLRNEVPSQGRPALVRNAGWPKARGRFVHFLDDDDRVAAGFYRAAVEAFEAHPDRGVVFGRIDPFADEPQADLKNERRFFEVATRRARLAALLRSRRWMTFNLLFKETMLVNSSGIVRRECVEALGGYLPELSMNEDVDFFCRAIRRFGFHFLDQVVLHYRIVPDSLMHGRADDEALTESYRLMYQRYRHAYGSAEFLAMKVLAGTLLRGV
jgi:glycosyltransferase involved in cell wall biosynthesis